MCRADGYAVFVRGAVKGERVAFEPVGVTSKYAKARLAGVLTPSPHRAEPFCPAFGRCGGCALQFVDYARHLEILRDGLSAALRRVPGIEGAAFPPVTGMELPYRYRCKETYAAVRENGRLRLGFLEEKSHTVIPVEECALARPEITEAARAVEAEADRLGPLLAAGLLRAMFRYGLHTGELMAVLETEHPLPPGQGLSERLSGQLPGLKSLYNKASGKNRLLWGQPEIYEKLLGLRFRISPDSFFQVNPAQAAALYGWVREYAKEASPGLLVDAYCGGGVIGLTASGAARRVLGVESFPEAVADARENARANGKTNVTFEVGRAEDVLPALLRSGVQPDMLVLDPPRQGADAALLQAAAEAGVPRIAYVSCNPFTLARDLTALAASGYRPLEVRGADMFPWTGHVECVVLMSRV